ncbi:hypothetical protein PI125_g11889 [Phytophthora idaei]|nr:hypothetical protein PI125_g11889 [Phytophthora idaei]
MSPVEFGLLVLWEEFLMLVPQISEGFIIAVRVGSLVGVVRIGSHVGNAWVGNLVVKFAADLAGGALVTCGLVGVLVVGVLGASSGVNATSLV